MQETLYKYGLRTHGIMMDRNLLSKKDRSDGNGNTGRKSMNEMLWLYSTYYVVENATSRV